MKNDCIICFKDEKFTIGFGPLLIGVLNRTDKYTIGGKRY